MSKWMLMALSVVTLGATACGGGAKAERMEQMVALRVEDALDELDATPAQRERVQAITKESLANAKPVVEQAQAGRAALVTEWKSERPDANRVHQFVDAQLDVVRAFAHGMVDKAIEVHQLLTPDQRAEITKRLERFEKRAKK